MVTGKVFSNLFCIISQFFCTLAKRGARDVFQKAIFFLICREKGNELKLFIHG